MGVRADQGEHPDFTRGDPEEFPQAGHMEIEVQPVPIGKKEVA